MKIARISSTFLALVAVLLLAATAMPAATILSGSFDISGTVTVNGFSSITWTLPPLNKALVGSASGSFAGLTGSEVTIANLTNPPDVVDASGFADQLFISFDAAPALQSLLINFIYAGVDTATACTALPAAAGQTCALVGSPFDFQNTAGGGSRAGFVFSGISSDGLSKWIGNFTVQFSVPYQTILTTLNDAGSVTNSFSGTFTVTPVPEPASWSLAIGAIGVLAGLWRRKRAKV